MWFLIMEKNSNGGANPSYQWQVNGMMPERTGVIMEQATIAMGTTVMAMICLLKNRFRATKDPVAVVEAKKK